MLIPNFSEKSNVHDIAYIRESVMDVINEIARLPVKPSDSFSEFYKKYAGSFSSDLIGFELLDLCDQPPNIQSVTKQCRECFGFTDKYLVLTELFCGSVLVLDCESDQVFNVDFEGGEVELLDGKLKPQWTCFYDFLGEYFGE